MHPFVTVYKKYRSWYTTKESGYSEFHENYFNTMNITDQKVQNLIFFRVYKGRICILVQIFDQRTRETARLRVVCTLYSVAELILPII